MLDQHFGDLIADAKDRVQAACGLLEDHGEGAAAQFDHLLFRQGDEVAATQPHFAFDDLAGAAQQPHDGEGSHALAAARFPHQAHDLAFADGKVNAVDGLYHAIFGEEVRLQPLDFEHDLGRGTSGCRFTHGYSTVSSGGRGHRAGHRRRN